MSPRLPVHRNQDSTVGRRRGSLGGGQPGLFRRLQRTAAAAAPATGRRIRSGRRARWASSPMQPPREIRMPPRIDRACRPAMRKPDGAGRRRPGQPRRAAARARPALSLHHAARRTGDPGPLDSRRRHSAIGGLGVVLVAIFVVWLLGRENSRRVWAAIFALAGLRGRPDRRRLCSACSPACFPWRAWCRSLSGIVLIVSRRLGGPAGSGGRRLIRFARRPHAGALRPATRCSRPGGRG